MLDGTPIGLHVCAEHVLIVCMLHQRKMHHVITLVIITMRIDMIPHYNHISVDMSGTTTNRNTYHGNIYEVDTE